ncbi:hypothetical protein V6L77_01530 [Pannonibacter sp. Pt2-lr]
MINKDVRGPLSFTPRDDHRFDLEGSYSRQGNLFAGDSQLRDDRRQRQEWPVRHRDQFDDPPDGVADPLRRPMTSASPAGYVQWERTLNRRLSEGPAGRVEGAILPDATWGTITLDNVLPRANGTCPCIWGL